MILAAPGSLFWMLRHEVRVGSRMAFGKGGGRKALWFLIGLIGLVHLVMWPVAAGLTRFTLAPTPQLLATLGGWLMVAWLFNLSTAMTSIIESMFVRGDLELLFSSPLSVRRVLLVRATAIALRSVAVFAPLVLPCAHMMALHGHPEFLSAYPMIIIIGLSSVAVGLVITSLLFETVGVRRARTITGVLAAIISGAAILSTQGGMIARTSMGQAIGAWLAPVHALLPTAPESVLWWPSRALFGESLPLLGLLAISMVAFLATVWLLAPRFATGVLLAGGSAAPAGRAQKLQAQRQFRSGSFQALVIKEWRMIIRDPWVLGSILSQMIYMLPVGISLLQGAENSATPLAFAAPIVVLLTSHAADGFVSATVNSEQAPKFLSTAPVSTRHVFTAKMTAALVPTALLMIIPVALMANYSLVASLVTLLACLAAGASAILISLWYARPIKWNGFNRPQKSSFIANTTILFINLGWAGAAGLAIAGDVRAVLPAAVALLVLLVGWGSRPR
jgi:ABC-2 type transport system permease protein